MAFVEALLVLCLASATLAYLADEEYLVNVDMEEEFDKDWLCYSACLVEKSTDSYAGLYSAKVTARISVILHVQLKRISSMNICAAIGHPGFGDQPGQCGVYKFTSFRETRISLVLCHRARSVLVAVAFAKTDRATLGNFHFISRVNTYSSVRQNVVLPSPGGTFYYNVRLKILNEMVEEFPMGHTLELTVSYVSGVENTRLLIAQVPRVRVSDGWVQVGADFRLPDGDHAGIEYLLDSVSLKKFNTTDDSVAEQNARIDKIRKGDLEMLIITPDGTDHNQVTIELEQVKHAFPFGIAVEGNRLWNDDEAVNTEYRNYVFDNFNWVTLANILKWRIMESQEEAPRFWGQHKALDVLTQRGIPVRGHCVSWGKLSKIMGWLLEKDPIGVKEAVTRRIEYLVREFNSTTIKHWDVNNENLHGSWFEEATLNDQFIQAMFTEMHDLQPDVKLFTNDYDAMSLSLYTSAYRSAAMKLRMNGVPIGGIGLQSHMSVYPDPDLLQKRLDVMAEAGLPLWITELDIRDADVNVRAQGYEDALRLFFSHPAVEGIVIWGFWDQGISQPDASLVDGPDFVENAAGQKVRYLLQNEWHTTLSHVPEKAVETFIERAFYGTYNLTLNYNGDVIWNGSIEHSPDLSRKFILTVDKSAPVDQIFRMSS
ncbi:hypothetical protein CAPTEDRAFT_194144 [Capitella teleta]|uniref:GH10 domain-containing protein n=1 Tax=Capitella teleta TaxID=283909 RepID=R7TEC7_CAPTE|nr:hypothetical protein CAPTEDRAFT_194144 [Capitella teleta]|eukprot:ELT91832.1 hypothetical protein CAPTEDRAFT_194144 [Capitella teleta]